MTYSYLAQWNEAGFLSALVQTRYDVFSKADEEEIERRTTYDWTWDPERMVLVEVQTFDGSDEVRTWETTFDCTGHWAPSWWPQD